MKWFVVLLLVIIIALLSITFYNNFGNPVYVPNPGNATTLLYFTKSDCSFCHLLEKEWHDFAEDSYKYNVRIQRINIDNPLNNPLMEEKNITAFPTLIAVRPGKPDVTYTGVFEEKAIKNWITELP